MKKLSSLSLALVLIFGLAATASASPFYLESAGVTIEVPEGMQAEDISDDNVAALGISVDGDDNLKYVYSLAYIEAFEGKWIEDLTDEEGQQLIQGVMNSVTDPQFDTAETDSYKLLLVGSGDGTQLHYMSLLNGWFCDVAAVRVNGTLTEEDIKAAAAMLQSIQFDADTEG
ncbi:hypothetical protein ACH6CV_16045 [Bacillota bacterium Meth-B3]|nr:hypothetical protein [Christensenellaceae bacterium]MEA5066075.1 hypothetical protein [Eubacteriales bacterium]MEA5067686.1 hypothetical protein [Christensenellaceae bacterium]